MLYSSGIIPFRRNDSGIIEFFLGHPGGLDNSWKDYWAYLKGAVEGEETWSETAIREFKEESGLEMKGITKNDLIPLGVVKQNKTKNAVAFGLYYPNIKPSECFSNMADNGLNPEIDRYAWLTFEEVKKYTHPTHITFYEQIIDFFS